MNFNGKNVLITGAHGNLGRAVARAFAQAGARVVLLDRHAAPLPEAGTGHRRSKGRARPVDRFDPGRGRREAGRTAQVDVGALHVGTGINFQNNFIEHG